MAKSSVRRREISGIRLFEERMTREERMEEFQDQIRVEMARTGCFWNVARQRAATRMGYAGLAKEEEILNDQEMKRLLAVEEIQREEEEWKLRQRVQEREIEEEHDAFDKILNGLATGPTDDDMTWVRTHPAMTRKQRTGEDVIVISSDIEGAPSRYAVNMLVNWVNEPKEFFKLVLQADKKRLQERGEQDRDEVEDDLGSIDELLGEFADGDD